MLSVHTAAVAKFDGDNETHQKRIGFFKKKEEKKKETVKKKEQKVIITFEHKTRAVHAPKGALTRHVLSVHLHLQRTGRR